MKILRFILSLFCFAIYPISAFANYEYLKNYYVFGDIGSTISNIELSSNQGYQPKNKSGKKLGTSPLYSLGFGHVFPKIRVDITISRIDSMKYHASYNFIKNNVTSSFHNRQTIKTTTTILSAYYDFMKDHKISPYIGLGLGLANVDAGNFSMATIASGGRRVVYKCGGNVSGANRMGYNLTLGANYKLTQSLSLNVNYKFYDLGKIRMSDRAELFTNDTKEKDILEKARKSLKLNVHAVSLGLRYDF